ncbi:hypothetical protein Tco_1563482 [Tanacetum coccineum]
MIDFACARSSVMDQVLGRVLYSAECRLLFENRFYSFKAKKVIKWVRTGRDKNDRMLALIIGDEKTYNSSDIVRVADSFKVSPTPYVPPSKKDYEILFQLLFDEYFNPPPRAFSPDPVAVAAPRVVDPADSP